MTQDQVNEKVMSTNGSVAELRSIGATASQLREAATWLSGQPSYLGSLVRSKNKADLMLGPAYPYERVTAAKARASACILAAAQTKTKTTP